jgi:hypothetical protein
MLLQRLGELLLQLGAWFADRTNASSRKSSSRFAANSVTQKLTPVTLPPGRAKLATSPSLNRVIADGKHDRDSRRCALCCGRRSRTSGHGHHGHAPTNQVGRLLRQPIHSIVGPAIFDCDILAFDIAGFF